MSKAVIGLDLGTTSVKAVAFNLTGNVLAESEEQIETLYPKSGYAEQDPDVIEKQTRFVLNTLLSKLSNTHVLSIGISCAMHSLICVDKQGKARSNMLIWSDGRSSDVVEQLEDSVKRRIYRKTGTPIHPMSPLLKLIWMKQVQDPSYQEASYYMSMKEYLLFQWSGERIIDYSMASATGLMNIHQLDWDDEALELAGISRSQLSTIVEPTAIITELSSNIQTEIGLSKDVSLVIGAADGQLANLGNGAIQSGEVAITVGTSGAIRQLIEGQHVNDNQETFSYAFTAHSSIIGGATNNGGIALQWIKDLFTYNGSHEELLREAEEIKIGSDGLLFVPYVNGERAPVWNQNAKGNFYGLQVTHQRAHFVRAVLEGITFNLYQIAQSLEDIAGKPKTISVNGGLSKSPFWVQMVADVFGHPIQLADTHHAAAWGAAWTSLVAIGEVPSFESIKENIPINYIVEPNEERHRRYQEMFQTYHNVARTITRFF
ncbi:carbohydrate kinase FGGY [Gracilibacillus halophilus YIM-C55.5]|uniref:Carbohydrate kinase FGGY n=1 Tax=Gracilibacillus halophilus YIM-C55.5 TaxID=1308866 RepID=N4W8N2_9BACI|nr:gluconokinase [Gracilibacillus halophilus]ENH96643.1 carbohydrate kinase FGGY [Gracilibacillus halophilus YIM-C55.5]